jgi:hypothetical protein
MPNQVRNGLQAYERTPIVRLHYDLAMANG